MALQTKKLSQLEEFWDLITVLGSWGFGKFIGNGSCILAESWTLYTTLHFVLDLNIKKIEIEIDSQELFEVLNALGSDFHPVVMLINDCRCVIFKFERIRIAKVRRCQNKCANKMAKMARLHWWPLRTFVAPSALVKELFLANLDSP